jgi:phosphate transport system substrate-binding protein
MRTHTRKLVAVLAATTLLASACGNGEDETASTDTTETATEGDDATTETTAAEGGMSGTVQLDGSSTVGPLSEVAAELYMQDDPDVRVTVAISGTGGGFEKFCSGETDANNSSREIKDEEAALCEENGIAYDSIQTANDALSLLVNPENPVECLTVEQANQIWDDGSGVSTWGDIDGLDLPEEFASQPVTLYGPGSDSGTFDFFTEAINGESGRIRNDYIDIGEDDNAAVTAVQGDVTAMGYVPFSYFQEAGDAVKALRIDDGDGCTEGTPETVQDGSYTPLGRGLFVYFSDTALAREEVVDFAEFYIDNAAQIADLAGFVPMTDEQLSEQNDTIDQLTSG